MSLKGLSAGDWHSLQAEYQSNRSYKARRVAFGMSRVNLNSFKDWLLLQGAEILEPAQSEAIRFRLKNGLHGVIYSSGSGSLWGHRKAQQWAQEFSQELER